MQPQRPLSSAPVPSSPLLACVAPECLLCWAEQAALLLSTPLNFSHMLICLCYCLLTPAPFPTQSAPQTVPSLSLGPQCVRAFTLWSSFPLLFFLPIIACFPTECAYESGIVSRELPSTLLPQLWLLFSAACIFFFLHLAGQTQTICSTLFLEGLF